VTGATAVTVSAGQEVLRSVPAGIFVDGSWRAASDGALFDVVDPATGLPIAAVSDGTVEDGDAALAAAATAQVSWALVPPRERSELLRDVYERVVANTDRLATIITLEMGKPVAESRAEVAYAAEYLRWFAEEAVRLDGRWLTDPAGGARLLTMRRPVGPTLMITPWNFPLAMGARKLAPALAAGCTMVVKPAAQTPLTMAAFVQLVEQAGVPAGVVNLVPTTRTAAVMEPLVRDPRTRKLTFTGSTGVGRLLVEQSATQLLRLSMELGGNAPFIVFEDADLDAAVAGALVAKTRNGGEACTAANRFLVHETIVAPFAARLTEAMRGLRVGSGFDPDVAVGPMIDWEAREHLVALVDDAVQRGARVQCGGQAISGPGCFFEPTVLTQVPDSARILHEEIFGPVAPISTFSSEADAVARANDTAYGLAAYVYTSSIERIIRVSESLEFGMVGANTGTVSSPAAPVGGMKASGFGREGGFEGIEEYLETTYVRIPIG
jgi:succinate-semialdehyde dehydrogenase/glutarate-semialdehyde dehydrogenase